jgi:pantoate--beta-alanine ligase
MLIFHQQAALRLYLQKAVSGGKKLGFVPTMGALHEGHMSLVEAAKGRNCLCIASIFVNPTQFTDPNDLAKYPRTEGKDIGMLEAGGCDVLYLPEVADVYQDGLANLQVNLDGLDLMLEGASRPGHFAGVATVVGILLDIVKPQFIFMGQKDYQQVQVVNQLIRHLNLSVELVMCPIIREQNGLAMSSRNRRLEPEQRLAAGAIFQTLTKAAREASKRELPVIEQEAREHLNGFPGFEVDYFGFHHAHTLRPVRFYEASVPMVLLTAVIVDGVRLLDNVLVHHSE